MPGSLYSRYGARDLAAMAERGTVLEGEIPLEKLPRLAPLLESARGSVRAAFRFRQDERGWPIIALEYDAGVRLVCQRCLASVDYELEDRVEFAVLESSAMAQHLPDEYEPLVLEDERLSPATLVEDELIISLPLVPRHEAAECSNPQGTRAAPPAASEGDLD